MSLRFWLTTIVLAGLANAQEPSGPLAPAAPPVVVSEVKPAAKPVPARLEGFVLNDSTGQPLRRAHIALNPLEAGLPATGTDADDQGHFLLRDIPAGQYSLSASRDGFLTNVAPLTGGLRMPAAFHIGEGDKIADLTFRLRPWAVIAGRLRYSDGDYAVGVRVELYRTDHIRGRSAYSLAATAMTNDRGEFRVYGLAPGGYLIASVFDPPATANYREQPMTDSDGRVLPAVGYATTFYPNTELMSQAVPVRLDYGQELTGLDLSLRQTRKIAIRGYVLNASTGLRVSSPGITLERVDQTGEGAMPINARVTFDRDNTFQISGVSPGSYRLVARATGEGGAALTGHTLLVTGNEDVDGLEIVAAPLQRWLGQIAAEGPGDLPAEAAPHITMEPRGMGVSGCVTNATPDKVTGIFGFECGVQRDEVYDVFADNLPGDYYLSAVRVGGVDVRPFGLPGSVASSTPFLAVLDSRGGRVSGAVVGENGVVWSGASLMLIPDPPQRRLQDYRSASADANGRFLFHGVAPGSYTLVGWIDQTPCDVYDPNGLDRCRAAGTPVAVSAGAEQNLIFTAHNPQ